MYNLPNRVFGLDVIRAAAILLVLFSHCTFILPEFNKTVSDGIRLLGATGVDIFFVLSGYLIGGILLKYLENGQTKLKDLIHFWKRRWLRTLPNYFAVLTINSVLALFIYRSLPDEFWLFFPFMQNFASAHPDFFTEAWSLSIEEYAYLFLPVLIYASLFCFKKVKASKLFLISTIVTIIILYLFKFEFYKSSEISSYKDWSLQYRKVVIYRLDAIYYGFLLIYFNSKYSFLKLNRIKLFSTGVIVFLLLHVLIVFLGILPTSHKGFYTFLYLPLVSLSIAIIFPFILTLKANKLKGVITYVSKRSYSIYLVNYSIVLLTLKQIIEVSVLAMFLYLLFTFVFSELLYKCIEIPFLRLRRKIAPR